MSRSAGLAALVREGGRLHPERLAVAGPDGRLTYGELDELADQAARALAAADVVAGDRVAVWLDKNAQTVAVLQGVLRLGAAYVPIDPLSPRSRAAVVIADCRPRVVVTTPSGAQDLVEGEQVTAAVLSTGADDTMPWPLLAGDGGDPLPRHEPGEDDLAYILYTSGSTGVPKGVCISHRNALAFVAWAATELDAQASDRFANHAPFHFDLSVLDLYAAFLAGASVHLVPSGMAYVPTLLTEFLHQEEITVWYSVPSVLMLMMREGGLLEKVQPPHLRALLFAGEPFPVKHLRRLVEAWPGTRFLNLYGPTETNVCTFYEVEVLDPDRSTPVPIGGACSGDRVWARTVEGTVAGPGEQGELVAEGPTVMLGYWGYPAHQGPYATGDLVTVLDDGTFDYVGRIDTMVKIRGHRMELGEIEAVLLEHPAVQEVAAVVTGANLDSKVVAFVVPEAAAAPSLLELKRHCAERLPRPVNVDAVRVVESVPRTPNGKTDRRHLATLASGEGQVAAAGVTEHR